MKKGTFIIIAFLAFAYVSPAQTKNEKTPEQKAENLTKKWTKILSLTAEQQPKVKSVFLDRAQKTQAVKTKYASATDKKAMHQEMKVIKDNTDASLKAILSPEQYATYVKTKEENKKKDKAEKDNPSDED